MMQNQFSEKFNLQAFIGAGVTILALIIVQHFFLRSPTTDEMMTQAAVEYNKKCPLMIDQFTRGDYAVSLPGKIFENNYTMMDTAILSGGLEDLKQNLEAHIINTLRTSPSLKIFRDNEITMVYNYRDIYGNFIFKISVGPDEYNKP